MDMLTTLALIGTARQEHMDMSTATPVDTLMANIAEGETERKLLLTAGAWAIYRQAGQVAWHLPTAPEPAAPESLRSCSSTVARLVQDVLTGSHVELLEEALKHLRLAGLHLPPELLSAALDMKSDEIRSLLLAVLGERGRWLSRFNPAWSWVAEALSAGEDMLPTNTETVWQEGTIGQRSEILRRLRVIDPAKAREWLEAVWQQEKAEIRAQFLEKFEIGLATEDETFLEKALDDRSANVRATAASLLARIPTSALSARMRTRADGMLNYAKGELTVTPPSEIDKQWQRDGIVTKPPSGIGKRAWWLKQVMKRVPLAHWEEQFGAAPTKLIAALRSTEWEQVLIEGWSQAAITFNQVLWVASLWDWWRQYHYDTFPVDVRKALMSRMLRYEAEIRVREQFVGYKLPENRGWEDLLAALPIPWSKDFGDAYLRALQNYTGRTVDDRQIYLSWQRSLTIATAALPPQCFAAVLDISVLPNDDSTLWHLHQWNEQLHAFTEAIQIRQRLMEEIAS